MLPGLIVAVPVVLAFAMLWWSRGGMIDWAISRERLAAGEWPLIGLHMLAHGGILHLGFNMAALLALTPAVMDRLGPTTPRGIFAYIVLLGLSGLGGLALWLAIPHLAPMLGLSGAIFGLVGFILRQPDPDSLPAPLTSRNTGRAFWIFIKLHLPLIAIFAIPLLLGAEGFGLAWEAHLGGFIAGLLLYHPMRALAGTEAHWPTAR